MRIFQAKDRQRGMTMIEVLVSIAVFAFGLLGVAGLLVLGIKSSYSSQQRSAATQLAYDIMDRTRSNNVGVNAGNYNQPATTPTAASYNTQQTTCVAATSSPGTGCAASLMAQNDLYEWRLAVQRQLGTSAAGIICLDSSGASGSYDGTTITPSCDGLGATYAVKIYWMDDRNQTASTPTYQGFVTRFLP